MINNIEIYNSRMDASIEDKLWFVDKVDADVYIDFGCANGNLLKHLAYIHNKQHNGVKQYIGYDINEEMIQKAIQNCNRYDSITFINKLDEIQGYCANNIIKGKKVCLILSSVMHEIYSYSTMDEIALFWSNIKYTICPDYIVIRDMCHGVNTRVEQYYNLYLDNYLFHIIREVKSKANKEQINDFEQQWGKICTVKGITHFLLKYKYVENWDRELKENYLPIPTFTIKHILSTLYNVTHEEYYCLPYLKNQFRKDFDIDFIGYTHYKMMFKLKN